MDGMTLSLLIVQDQRPVGGLRQRPELQQLPMVRSRENFCRFRQSLDAIDPLVVVGDPGSSSAAIMLEMEVERLDRQRLRDFRRRLDHFHNG